jgi:hypothetical protein
VLFAVVLNWFLSANYSLSGHLTLTLETPAPTGSLPAVTYAKPETVHLSSLELVFEGKAEMGTTSSKARSCMS